MSNDTTASWSSKLFGCADQECTCYTATRLLANRLGELRELSEPRAVARWHSRWVVCSDMTLHRSKKGRWADLLYCGWADAGKLPRRKR